VTLLETTQKQLAQQQDPQNHQKTLKSSSMKTAEEELGLKQWIQNHAPAVIDHANVAFQSSLKTFIGSITAGARFQHFHFDTFPATFC
jgi:hypothetical protein